MFQHYLALALRNLQRNRRYVLINVLGLGTALGFCILSYLNYRFANTFDVWHSDAGRIVRVETVKASNHLLYGVCPAAIGPAAAADLPAVESACRYDSRSTVVKRGDRVFNENLFFADDNFFQFFDFPLAKGRADLKERNTVVIDEDTALKYFGQEEPVGQSLLFYADEPHPLNLTVAGVVKNIPLNSSLRFRFLTHLDNHLRDSTRYDYVSWQWAADAVFLKLKQAGDAPAVEQGLQAYVAPRNVARPDWTVESYRLEPMLAMAHSSRFLRHNGLWQGVPPAAVWGNATIALLLLLTAALNFANMTIANCNRRLREMGVRKVMGGTRFQLMRQLLLEAFAIVLLSSVLGLLLATPLTNWFNSMWKFTDLRVDYTDPSLLIYLLAAAAGTTLLAGSYPAFYLSGFRPASIFRGGVLMGGSNPFSKIMMGVQVAISIIAVVVGLSFAYNAAYNRQADIGFSYQPVLQAWLPNPGDYRRFEDAVRNLPGVVATAGSMDLPGFGYTTVDFNFQERQQDALLYRIGNDFTHLMQMRLVAGEWPAPAGDTSRSNEIVINQALARAVGGEQAILGARIQVRGRALRVSGVVADFMTNSPFMPISPAILQPVPIREYQRCLILTENLADQPRIMADIEAKWKTLFPYMPFNVGYQNEILREALEVSENIATSMSLLGTVAILLTITGLFSLVSLNILRRLREVAVRRVLGASAGHVTWLLNKSYLWIFALAVVVGCIAGRFMALKLMDSIFKINAGVQTAAMLWSAVGILLVSAMTIGIKIWQTLRINPADVLRGD